MNEYPKWKTIAVGYSLANLWFIGAWKELIFSSTYHYFDAAPHTIFEIAAVLINVLVLTLVLAVVLWLARPKIPWLASASVFQWAFLVLGLLSFCSLSYELVVWLVPAAIGFGNLPLPALVLIGCGLLALPQSSRLEAMIDNLRHLAFVLLPFSLLLLLQAGWYFFAVDETEFEPREVQRTTEHRQGPLATKVVWVIFDELDYATLEAANGTPLKLPAFSRLQSQSFTATNALSPTDETLSSIPSLLTGVRVKESRHNSTSNLLLVTENDGKFDLADTTNIFRELRPLGVRNGIVGWYHPYSRIFRDDASSIYWQPYSDVNKCSSGINGFASCVRGVFFRSIVQVPFANVIYPPLMSTGEEFMGRVPQQEMHPFITEKAEKLISDPDTDFVFLHFSVPHDPFIKPQGFEGEADYFSSLLVADQALQTITDAIEKSGAADKTVLIVSSDHRWRHKTLDDFEFLEANKARAVVDDRRVPFIVRFPKQENRFAFEENLNTIVSEAIIEDVFRGRITGPTELDAWLRKRSTGSTPSGN